MTRIAFLGTPQAAIPTLELLAPNVSVVITRPDKPGGRSKRLRPTPIKVTGEKLGLYVVQPRGREELTATIERAVVDVAVVVAYGMIIPEAVLDLVEHGFLNVHFSLLPRWRGAAPVERAILEGDRETGVSIIKLDTGLDTGPILASTAVSLLADDDAATITTRLAKLGAELMADILPEYLAGTVHPVPQPDADVTYARRFDASETKLDFGDDVNRLDRVIRASTSRGGAYALHQGERLKIWRARPVGRVIEPGRLDDEGGMVCVGTGSRALELLEVQPAGGKRMEAAAWARGHGLGVLR